MRTLCHLRAGLCTRVAVCFLLTWVCCMSASLNAQEPPQEPPLDAGTAEVLVDDVADLHAAAKSGDLESAKMAMAVGVDLNQQEDVHGLTPLSWAALTGNSEIVDLLLESGADVNARNRDGGTALHAAVFLGQSDVAQQLLNAGADVNAEDWDGNRPIHVLGADWELTQQIAQAIDIEIERESVDLGRRQAARVLQEHGAKKGDALIVISIVAASIVGVLLIVGVIVLLVHLSEKKRTEDLRSLASQLGLQFQLKDEQLLNKLKAFELFNKGHSRKMKNVMRAETEAARLSIFDYNYTTGGGKNSRTHRHTIVAMESDSLQLPNFSLRPEGFFDKIGATLGFQDIDFDEHPEFSRMFVLKGRDETMIRQFFDVELLDHFSHQKKARVEAQPGLFIYLRGGRQKPEEVKQLMTDGYTVYKWFSDRSSK